jgi:hypothetical protein
MHEMFRQRRIVFNRARESPIRDWRRTAQSDITDGLILVSGLPTICPEFLNGPKRATR